MGAMARWWPPLDMWGGTGAVLRTGSFLLERSRQQDDDERLLRFAASPSYAPAHGYRAILALLFRLDVRWLHYNPIRPLTSLNYRSPAPETWQPELKTGYGEVESVLRFPLPHTLDGDEILTKLVALH